MAFFNFRRKKNLGETPDTPFVIDDVPSHKSGVAKEYRILNSLFGVPGKEWHLLSQALIQHKGRSLDQMKIEIEGKQKRTFYFDVTALFSLPQQTAEEQAAEERYQRAQANMERLFRAHMEGGESGFHSEFNRLFPKSENDESNPQDD